MPKKKSDGTQVNGDTSRDCPICRNYKDQDARHRHFLTFEHEEALITHLRIFLSDRQVEGRPSELDEWLRGILPWLRTKRELGDWPSPVNYGDVSV